MKEKNYTLNSEPLEHFRRNAELNAPAFVNFSEQVMNRIQQESAHSLNDGARNRNRTLFRFASTALAVTLLSGFAYAASTGWIRIKDESGREVMQVSSAFVQHTEQEQFIERVHQAVKGQLQSGEAAFVVHDQAGIDSIRSRVMPMSFSVVRRGVTYTSIQDVSSRFVGPLSELKLPDDQVVDAKFINVEVLPDTGTPSDFDPEKWVEAVDTDTGSPYAYYKFKTVEDVNLNFDAVRLNYQDEEATFTLMVNYAKIAPYEEIKVYDKTPSAERVYESHGIPIYHSEGNGEPFFIWRQPVEDGSLSLIYILMGEGEAEKQLEFAKSFIEANASESE